MQILFDPHIGAIRARGEKPVGQKKLCGINVGFKQKKNDKAQAIDNEIDSITYAVDLAKRVKLLLEESRPYGIYHLTNSGQGSQYDFAVEIFKIVKPEFKVEKVSAKQFTRRAANRPVKSVLLNTKLPELRSWQAALGEFLTANINHP